MYTYIYLYIYIYLFIHLFIYIFIFIHLFIIFIFIFIFILIGVLILHDIFFTLVERKEKDAEEGFCEKREGQEISLKGYRNGHRIKVLIRPFIHLHCPRRTTILK